MSVPLQSRFPRLWLVAQYLLCGVLFRRRYVVKDVPPGARVMEIGCSLGLDSIHFRKNTSFLGVDIDPVAIAQARKRFATYPNMRFVCQDARTLKDARGRFDRVILCGSCHHIPDAELVSILRAAADYLTPNGRMVLVDYATNPNPGLFARFILALEEGRHVRTTRALSELVGQAGNLRVVDLEEFDNPAFVGPWPIMGRKLRLELARAGDAS
ncbi:hypothetical protein JCM15519_19070 [Fundidesulfovibrio butyratiphilus]